MKVSAFHSLFLVFVLAWVCFYAAVRETYNGISEYKFEVEKLKEALVQERIHTAMNQEYFLEFRQQVALLMPGALKENETGEEGYAVRSLASVATPGNSDVVRGAIVKTLFERGKEHFRNKRYDEACRIFQTVMDRYSYSPFVIESLFLLAESRFQQNELEEATRLIQQMVEQFPQAELTGFAMVRLGKVFEMQSRNDDAVEIYKTVIRSFPQRDVASQAKLSLKGMEL